MKTPLWPFLPHVQSTYMHLNVQMLISFVCNKVRICASQCHVARSPADRDTRYRNMKWVVSVLRSTSTVWWHMIFLLFQRTWDFQKARKEISLLPLFWHFAWDKTLYTSIIGAFSGCIFGIHHYSAFSTAKYHFPKFSSLMYLKALQLLHLQLDVAANEETKIRRGISVVPPRHHLRFSCL